MRLFAIIAVLLQCLSTVVLSATPKRETLQGYFVQKQEQLYFTERFHSTAPVYRVQWWNEKAAHRPLCAVNLIATCKAVVLNFEKKIISQGSRREVVLAHAILDSELKKSLSQRR